MMIRLTTIISAVLGALLLLTSGSHAADGGNKEAAIPDGPLVLQMQPFMAPAQYNKNKPVRMVAVTPFALIDTQENLAEVCKNFPKVKEALQIEVSKETLSFENHKPDTKNSGHLVKNAVNKALNKKVAHKGYLINKAMSFGSGTASKLPGSTMGCQRSLDLPDEIKRSVALDAARMSKQDKKDTFQKRIESRRKYKEYDRKAKQSGYSQ